MNRLMHKVKIGLIVMASAVFGVTAVAGDNGSTGAVVMEVIRGTLSFEVATNVPALRVHGKSSAIAGVFQSFAWMRTIGCPNRLDTPDRPSPRRIFS